MANKAGVGMNHHHNPNVAGHEAADLHAPQAPQELVSFGGCSGPFFGSYGSVVLPADCRLPHPYPADGHKELCSLGVCSPRPLSEIFQKQLLRLLVRLRFLARRFPWLQGAALIELLAVTTDRCRSAPNRRAVSLFGTPFFTDSTIFSLRSSEYALMASTLPVAA
jgi:hypothetical protein